MLAGPRINEDYVTPSWGLYIKYYTTIHIDSIYMWIPLSAENPLLGVVAISA
jgi:hypothetical protein